MNNTLDVIDRLDAIDGFVKLVMTNGEIIFGKPLCIIFLEDEDGWETIKRIHFKPYHSPHTTDYGLDDIDSFERIKKEDIPLNE